MVPKTVSSNHRCSRHVKECFSCTFAHYQCNVLYSTAKLTGPPPLIWVYTSCSMVSLISCYTTQNCFLRAVVAGFKRTGKMLAIHVGITVNEWFYMLQMWCWNCSKACTLALRWGGGRAGQFCCTIEYMELPMDMKDFSYQFGWIPTISPKIWILPKSWWNVNPSTKPSILSFHKINLRNERFRKSTYQKCPTKMFSGKY